MIKVRGQATPEELAVLVALLGRGNLPREPTPYDRWRAGRLAALRRDPAIDLRDTVRG